MELRLTVCCLIAVCVLATTPVVAQEYTGPKWETDNVDYIDSNGDGKTDTVQAQVDFTGDGDEDTIVIHDLTGLSTRGHWSQSLDYDNDIVLYDEGSDNRAEIAVRFLQSGTNRVARIYDLKPGGALYEPAGEDLLKESLQNPVIRVRSEEPWVDNERVGYNITMYVQNPVRSSFNYPEWEMRTDRVRTEITVSDIDGDGSPDYEIRQIRADLPQSAGYTRSEVAVSTGSEEALQPDDGLLWPYLGGQASYIKGYNDVNPPIQIDWENGSALRVGELVATRGDEDNYFIYSTERLRTNRTNELDFEYPFAFYDLAQDDDGRPEMLVRSEYTAQGSQRGLGIYPSRTPTTVNEIRYAWDQDNDNRWDYKLGGTLTKKYRQVTEVGQYRFYSPGYDSFPGWVRSNDWESVTFVSAVGGRRGSEGIYEGGYSQRMKRVSVGLSEGEGRLFNPPERGFRLEVGESYDKPPEIYFSPVDGKWHLYAMSYGYLNQSDTQISYLNSDEDPFIDEWHSDQGRNPSTLVVTDWGLVHVQNQTVSRKAVRLGNERTVVAPPATKEEWEKFGERASATEGLEDPETIFAKFESESEDISSISTRSIRTVQDGEEVRVYADVVDEFTHNGQVIRAGEKVVIVVNKEGLRIHEATQSVTRIDTVQVEPRNGSLGERFTVATELTNTGWQVAENVTVRVRVKGRQVAHRNVTVEGKSTTNVSLSWWANRPATSATVEVSNDDNLLQEEVQVNSERLDRVQNYDQILQNGFHPAAVTGAVALLLLSILVVTNRLFQS